MRYVLFFGSLAIAGIAAFACTGETVTVENESDGGPGSNQDGGGTNTSDGATTGSNSGEGTAGTGQATGLPCDVQAVIENRCIACHDGSMKASGAPPMLNYSDLVAKSVVDPTKTIAQEAVVRMQAKTMPPKPAAPPDTDAMACTDYVPSAEGGTTNTLDGGAIPEGGLDASANCTRNAYWDGGNTPSDQMNPGEACNACHQVMGGPNLAFAGTVYKTPHEPDLCFGQAPPPTIKVTITDSMGRTQDLTVNAGGNFQGFKQSPPLKAPFRAKLSDGTNTRAMIGSVTSGDCNSCHTVLGKNTAPGRIVAP
jgi:hypothetical protein